MPKGRKAQEDLKSAVLQEYYAGIKTTQQIAAEYGIDRRRIYDWKEKKTDRRNSCKGSTRGAQLTLEESELVLLMIMECDSTMKGKQRETMRTLEEKMLNISDQLTELKILKENF